MASRSKQGSKHDDHSVEVSNFIYLLKSPWKRFSNAIILSLNCVCTNALCTDLGVNFNICQTVI